MKTRLLPYMKGLKAKAKVEGVERLIFRRNMLKRWVRVLTGYDYDEWWHRWKASGEPKIVVTRPVAFAPGLDPRLLYVLTAGTDPQDLLRSTEGMPFATYERHVAVRWTREVTDAATAAWTYRSSRRTDPLDLVPRHGPGLEKIVCCRIMRSGTMTYVPVRGHLLGFSRELLLPLLAPSWWPHWHKVKGLIDAKFPDAIWTTWHDRVEVHKRLYMPIGDICQPSAEVVAEDDLEDDEGDPDATAEELA